MMSSKKKRRAIRFVFGWMMSGSLLLLVTLGASSILMVPQEAQALEECIAAGACYTEDACGEIPGSEWSKCGTRCAKEQDEAGVAKRACGKCRANEGYCYPAATGVELAIHIGETTSVLDVSQYLESVYDFAIGIAGGIAGVMLMIGGFQYLTAGGAADRVSAAKKRISDALVGLALVLGAFLLLNTISPDLVKMYQFRVPMIQKKVFSQCAPFEPDVVCGKPFGLIGDPPKPGKGDDCLGKSCSRELAGMTDEWLSCQNSGKTHKEKPKTPVAPYWCELCGKTGDACGASGMKECCSTICSDKECSTGKVSADCENNNECESGLCQTRLGNSCSAGHNTNPCDNDSECRDNHVCIEVSGWHVCVPKGSTCMEDSDCEGQTCVFKQRTVCSGGQYGPSECQQVDIKPGACGGLAGKGSRKSGTYCIGEIVLGVPLGNNDACLSGKCNDNAVTGYGGICVEGNVGDGCDEDGDCKNNRCWDGGDWGVCVSGEKWAGCDEDNDCDASKFICDQSNNRCIDKS